MIGEKLLNFLEAAETDADFRAEIPAFVDEIKTIFERWQLVEFFETPWRLGALGHTAPEEAHQGFRSQLEESESLRDDARNLLLLERAREWLLEEENT